MNVCPHCHYRFESPLQADQDCPKCGQPIELELDPEEPSRTATSSSDDDFEMGPASGDETATIGIENIESAGSDQLLDSSPGQDQTTEAIDNAGFESTANLTMEVDEQDADDDFEVAAEETAPPPTEFYESVQGQPTIELEQPPRPATAMDYAERKIAGLAADTRDSNEADYVIAMQEEGSELGSGASGVVYKATQKSLGRVVAIKLLKKQVQAETQQSRKTTPKPKDIEKFLYESQITAGLDHPNVITVHDLGITGNDTLFYSMKLFEGGRDWSKDFDQNSLEQNLDIFNDVCDAMRRAHRDRIVHRDLKPQNVLVGDFGEVQVTDWGLAIDLKREPDDHFSGGGTPCYMAPEMSKHYLAQQNARLLRAKLDITRRQSPDAADELAELAENVRQKAEEEQSLRSLINELSDVYVLGAILFQIAAGYPPHLFQINDLHRRKWGSQAGRNKVRQELEMSANRTIARYLVKNLTNPEAREALKDIALQAMAAEPGERYSSVADLQQAVRDFRDFMRCIEDTQRGNREVEHSGQDPKSYVQLNNAIYAYEGALENYPDYQPASEGLANAKYLFADRALKNQDFELGLSTMTESAIDQQLDQEAARRLRQQLITQRKRRDRRKRLLFAATIASLVSIAVGSLFAALAVYARIDAANQTRLADAKKTEAETAELKAADAQRRELSAKNNLLAELRDVRKATEENIELKVNSAIGQRQLEKIEQEKQVAGIEKSIAEIDKEIQQVRSRDEMQVSGLEVKLAELSSRIAERDRYAALIDSEEIKERTQYEQYLNRLKTIETYIDEDITKSSLMELFNSRDVSLPVKNAWELHHLFKRANPTGNAAETRELGRARLLDASADGQRIVAVGENNQVYQSSADQLDPVRMAWIGDLPSPIVSIDVSDDGRWLVIACGGSSAATKTGLESLPLIFDLENRTRLSLDPSIIEQLSFVTVDDDGTPCKEKFYCDVQHVQLLRADEAGLELFMVDQRTPRGVNQFRCSVMNLIRAGERMSADVRKVKVSGQVFIRNPGLLTPMRCLATATRSDDGSIYVAIINSQPGFALTAFSFDDAFSAGSGESGMLTIESENDYFRKLRRGREFLESLSLAFAPTALRFTRSATGETVLLVGNGKGELARIVYRPGEAGSFVLHASNKRMLDPASTVKLIPDTSVASQSDGVEIRTGRKSVLTSTRSLTGTNAEPTTAQRSVHKTAIRSILELQDRIYSVSESEILIWTNEPDGLIARRKLFGQAGKIACAAIARVDSLPELFAISNFGEANGELRRWQPESDLSEATVRLDDFRNQRGSAKQIVAGAADSQPESQSIVLAFDDGTFEYFSPEKGSRAIGRLSEAMLDSDRDAMSRDDFRNGRFAYFPKRRQMAMYSNSLGLLLWNLDDPAQTDPIRSASAATIYAGSHTNSSVFLAADSDGQKIVTSHPRSGDKLVLWQRMLDGRFEARELGPFEKLGARHPDELNLVVQPAISPDGKVLAAVLRFRNSYQMQLFSLQSASNPVTLAVIDGEIRSSFRSIQFLDSQQLVVSEDIANRALERELRIFSLKQASDGWVRTDVVLPDSLTRAYRQLSVADVTWRDGNILMAGFGIPVPGEFNSRPAASRNDPGDESCFAGSGRRTLLVWNSSGILKQEPIQFSRRISPTFDAANLRYLVADSSSGSAALRMDDLSPDADTRSTTLNLCNPDSGQPAVRWQNVADGAFVAAGNNWFQLTIGRDPVFDFSLENPARHIELAGEHVLAHHQDNSVSLVNLQPPGDFPKPEQVHRLAGFHELSAMSPDGTHVALADREKGQISMLRVVDLFDPAGNIRSNSIQQQAVGLTWLTESALNQIGVEGDEECLVTAEVAGQTIRLRFWSASGTEIQVDPSLATLPLKLDRKGRVKSFELSSVTGSLAAIVWDTDEQDRADIWNLSATRKREDDEDPSAVPRKWFLVDASDVGQIESVSFSEVMAKNISAADIAPRIVISVDQQGSKAVKLFALELGLQFQTRPLVDLFVADKLQRVDRIVGAQFSGDGKTLLTMTADAARVRLSAGWELPKTDVDFASRIQQFQLEIEDSDRDRLQAELNDISARRRSFQPDPGLSGLEEKKDEQNDQLAVARSQLQELIDRLNSEESEIRSQLKREYQTEIDTYDQRIEELIGEIKSMEPVSDEPQE